MKLHRNGTNWNRDERNKTNDNWDEIEGNYNNVVENVSDKAFDKVVDSAKLNWKEPVNEFSDLPTDAQEGDTRMNRENGKVYRFNGEEWQEIQQIDPTFVNEVENRLSQRLDDYEEEINGRMDDYEGETSDRIESELDSMRVQLKFDGVLLELGKKQTIPSSAYPTVVEWGTVLYDTSEFFDSLNGKRITIPGGIDRVRLTANILWDEGGSGYRWARMIKNGEYTSGLPYVRNTVDSTTQMNLVSSVIEVSEGDYFEVEVTQKDDDNNNKDLRKDPYTTFSLEVVEHSKKKS